MFIQGRDTTQYLYGNPGNPFQLTASRSADNTLTTYSYDTSGNLFAFERAGARYYVATDHLGTPKVVTYDNGTIVKQAEYDAWGVKLSDSAPSFDLPVGFAGGIPEPVTGLVRFGFRDYEPGTGRWVAKDPILFEGGQGNLYSYARNNAANYVDLDGLRTWAGRLNLTFIFADITLGVVVDDAGSIGLQFTPAVGLSLSAGVTAGITTTDAPCISSLEGYGTSLGDAVNVNIPLAYFGGEGNRVWTGLPNNYYDPNGYRGWDAGYGIGIGLPATPQMFTGYTLTLFQMSYK